MSKSLLVAIAVIGLGLAACGTIRETPAIETVPTAIEPGDSRSLVLVELFTSEGCSSCPPADRLLSLIAATDDRAVALAFHVDYWDSPAWRDRFSSHLFSQRQEFYGGRFKLDSIYTPQIVVDGSTQFVGNDSARAGNEITEAAKVTKGALELRFDAGRLAIKADGFPSSETATLYLAVAENSLMTNVTGGENGGTSLRHSAVVRSLTTVRAVEKGTRSLDLSTDIPSDPSWNVQNLNYVIFVQENGSRRIIAVAQIAGKH
ncbi:MAG TPA: DUF1223 domain-containing protein [Pyrinomonadaceae bacterium]|nr:DUF1223 domain-containing protein [Pyrinomonadaceae bacterium]